MVYVSGYCPHPYCERESNFTPAPLSDLRPARAAYSTQLVAFPLQVLPAQGGGQPFIGYMDARNNWWWMAKCNACQQPVLICREGTTIYPQLLPGPVDENIPDPMRKDLMQAKRCMMSEAYDAAATMARRALQSLAVDQGAPRRKPDGRAMELAKQLKHLQDAGKITPTQRELTEASRWLGNHGAHENEPELDGDGEPFITDVSQEDAEDAIALVEELCHSLYVHPAKARRQLEKRGKR